jgi:glucose/arabinose dehydrogenase
MLSSEGSIMPRSRSLLTALAVLAFSSVSLAPSATAATRDVQVPGGQVTVFATGFDNPRGLAFGPDGRLYVAEGGRGGTASTVGQCQQVPDPIGPYTGGFTARISRVDHDGERSTVVDGLPSSATSSASGGLVSGVAAVAFLDGQLYAVTAGAGCSHGLAGTHNAVLRIHDHSAEEVADLSAFQMANPVAHPSADDFEPDGTWYSMVASRGALYAVEPNHGELDRISRSGEVERVVDVSAELGHVVPTSLAVRHGRFSLSNLGTFPVNPGTQFLATATRKGDFQVERNGLTAVLGLAFDRRGHLFALESTTAAGAPTPGTGKVVEVTEGDTRTVVDGLTFPTGMTFGPDGSLYVSNFGFGLPPGAGQILRICLPDAD